MVSRIGLALALAGACATVHVSRHHAHSHHEATQRYEDIYYLPGNRTLTVMSLGHREALADLIWLRALVYFGEELFEGGNKVNMLKYAEAMLSLDPYFKRTYQWVGTVALYRSGVPRVEDMWVAIEYLERGVRMFPDDGELAWGLGATYAYELTQFEKDEDKRNLLRAKGHEHLRVAVLRGAAPKGMAMQTAQHFAKGGRTQEAIRHLREVLFSVKDEETRTKLEWQLRRLTNAGLVEQVAAFRKVFNERKRANFPYLDDGLFALVGDRLEGADIPQLEAGFEPAHSTLTAGSRELNEPAAVP